MKSVKLYFLIIIISLLLLGACSFEKSKETGKDETKEDVLVEGDVKIEEMTQDQRLSLPYYYFTEGIISSLNELEDKLGRYDRFAVMRVKVLDEPRDRFYKSTITSVKVLEVFDKGEFLGDYITSDKEIKLQEDYRIIPDEDGRLIMDSLTRCTPLEDNMEYIVFTYMDQYFGENTMGKCFVIVPDGAYLISQSENISEHLKSEKYLKIFEEVKAKYLIN